MTTTKRSSHDEKLARLLKHGSMEAKENEWFTPRLLNKLPIKKPKSKRWIAHLLYVVALLVCAGSWAWSIHAGSNFTAITVRDLLAFTFMIVITLLLVLSATRHFFNAD